MQGRKLRMAASLMLLSIADCSASFRLDRPGGDPSPQEKAQAQAAEAIVIERELEAMCQARAAHFRGLVTMPCADIAREVRP